MFGFFLRTSMRSDILSACVPTQSKTDEMDRDDGEDGEELIASRSGFQDTDSGFLVLQSSFASEFHE
jgi:hypothetical protein